MKKIFFLILIFSAASSFGQGNFLQYTCPEYKFSIDIPEGWELELDTVDFVRYLFYNPYTVDTSYPERIEIFPKKEEISENFNLDSHYDASMAFIFYNTPDFEKVESGQSENEDVIKNKWIIYKSGKEYEIFEVYYDYNEFYIQCSSKIEFFNDLRPLFEHACQSLKKY